MSNILQKVNEVVNDDKRLRQQQQQLCPSGDYRSQAHKLLFLLRCQGRHPAKLPPPTPPSWHTYLDISGITAFDHVKTAVGHVHFKYSFIHSYITLCKIVVPTGAIARYPRSAAAVRHQRRRRHQILAAADVMTLLLMTAAD